MKKRRLAVVPFLLYGGLMLYVFLNKGYQHDRMTWFSDKSGYYAYLPAVYIAHDLPRLDYYMATNERMDLTAGIRDYGTHVHPVTGRRIDKYPVGVAMTEAIPFLVANALAARLGHAADGYSPPYAIAISASFALIVALGLWWLLPFAAAL